MIKIAYLPAHFSKTARQFWNENYTKKKKTLQTIKEGIKVTESQTGQEVTCKKGCSYCCSLFIEATIQECETIVYKLYQKPEALISFLQNYPKWREQIRSSGDLIKGRGRFWNTQITPENTEEFERAVTEEELKYLALNIPCPFLLSDACTIYNFRPYTCASYGAFSPNEWCKSGSPNKKKTFKLIPNGVLSDDSFYFVNKLPQPILFPMVLAVHEILEIGLYYFSEGGATGLEYLSKNWLSDPAVQEILLKYKKGYFKELS